MAAQNFTQIYVRLPVFGKCLKWVFHVCFRTFSIGRDSLEVKKIVKVNYSCHGWSFLRVGECVLRKTQKGAFTLSMVVAPKWFHNRSLCLYSSKRWKSILWYNLHKEHNGVNDFFKKETVFLSFTGLLQDKVRLQAYYNIKFFYRLITIRTYYLFCLKTKRILNIILIADDWLTNVISRKKN